MGEQVGESLDSIKTFSGLEQVRAAAQRALGDVHPVSDVSKAVFYDNRTATGRNLPEHYLVHFLLIDLLAFPSLGRDEKVAWTIPVQFKDRILVIEHRKFGLGVFAQDAIADNELAQELIIRIQKAIKAAQPYFDWMASHGVEESLVNVVNNASYLFGGFEFLLGAYRAKRDEAIARQDERVVTEHESPYGKSTTVFLPSIQLENEAHWLALATVDAFYSWTEHVFIHLAILTGKATTEDEVTKLAKANWPTKFKDVLDITDTTTKRLYDDLIEIRNDIRNFIAHGAFGKDRQAYSFHSRAGAVPALLPHQAENRRFMISSKRHSDTDEALTIIEEFIEYLWTGIRSPARIYIQDSGLDSILPMASDGTYENAMSSDEEMEELVDRLHYFADQAANMDW